MTQAAQSGRGGRSKETRIELDQSQFQITPNGDLVVKEEEVTRAIQQQPAQAAGAAAAASRVSVGVVVTIR